MLREEMPGTPPGTQHVPWKLPTLHLGNVGLSPSGCKTFFRGRKMDASKPASCVLPAWRWSEALPVNCWGRQNSGKTPCFAGRVTVWDRAVAEVRGRESCVLCSFLLPLGAACALAQGHQPPGLATARWGVGGVSGSGGGAHAAPGAQVCRASL